MKIRVYNVVEGEKLPLHLPLIVGDIDSMSQDGEIEVWNSSRQESVPVNWPVIEGAFKVLVRLLPGENLIHLRHQQETLQLTLTFNFPHFKYFVRPIYIVCDDDDGYFQGPEEEDCSLDSALERIKLAAMLIQTFTAEKMKEHGFGRQTFQLEIDSNYEPICNLFRSKLTLERAHSMQGNELWTYFARELMTSSNFRDKENCKWYCFMSFTRYSPPEGVDAPKTHSDILRYTQGHTALGGGGLALFGTGNLHTWAASINEVHKRFTDCRKIDRAKLMDDSAYREYYWANYATGLGASLHELGHTFDLAHTPSGIMARGFDDLHKVFIVQRSKVSSNSNGSNGNTESTSQHTSRERLIQNLSSGVMEVTPAHNQQSRRYKDICYGSPYRKAPSRRNSNGNTYIAPPPLVFKVEKGFTLSKTQTSLSISVKNYDGSHTHQTIMQEADYDTVTEVTLGEDGQMLARSSRRERRPSTSSNCSSLSSQSPTRVVPSMLPNSPTETELRLPDIQYADDGAHWYRASAVLLRFHRWFNRYNIAESKRHMSITGSRIKSSNGFRLVELRSDPEGVVFHHWEFLSETPPTEFTLKSSRVKNIPAEAKTVTVLAEDNMGNVLKKKMNLVDFER